jgi:hypothetical protein
MTTRAELIITALQQRIAELELDKAILRAELTELMGKDVQKETAIQSAENSH